MTVWAHVIDDFCDNVIVLDTTSGHNYPMNNLVEIDSVVPMPGVGWRYKDGQWAPNPTPSLFVDPQDIPNDDTTTSMVTYNWSGWPEDTPPATVDFDVDGSTKTADLTNNQASITVRSSESTDGKTITITCMDLTVVVNIDQ